MPEGGRLAMISRLFLRGLCCSLGLLVLACGGSKENDRGDDHEDDNVSGFVGHWVSTRTANTDSCAGAFEGDGGFRIELREGDASDLEFVEFSQTEPGKISCVQRFDVRGNVANLKGEQACDYESTTFDETGEEIVSTTHTIYTADRIELLDNGTLAEEGASEFENPDGEICKNTFEVDYEREDD
jgi:hypothetical protein